MNATTRLAATLAFILLAALQPALAGPGAHGPNGEHLDAAPTLRAAAAWPRLETHTEAFELVAELRGGELVILVDRYESNEPVLGAKLEVDLGSVKAAAAFRPEQGDYAVTDAMMLKALAAPGEHGLVFTLVAGAQSDLLDGTLVAATGAPAAPQGGPGHDGGGHAHEHQIERALWTSAGVLTLGLVAGIAWWWQRRRVGAPLQEGL